MSNHLTPRQQQILQLIQDHLQETGYPPTRMEIAQKFGFKSANAAEEHLRALEKKGFISMIPGASRGIRITQSAAPSGLPIVGQVAAGQPILAQENLGDYYEISADAFKPTADFLLRVKGMSMKDAGILDGDLLAVHKTTQVHNGQIVVARIHDEVTVKRFKKVRDQVHLLPENDAFEPIIINLKEEPLEIEGLGVGIIRNGLY